MVLPSLDGNCRVELSDLRNLLSPDKKVKEQAKSVQAGSGDSGVDQPNATEKHLTDDTKLAEEHPVDNYKPDEHQPMDIIKPAEEYPVDKIKSAEDHPVDSNRLAKDPSVNNSDHVDTNKPEVRHVDDNKP